MPLNKRDTLLLIDCSIFLHKAFDGKDIVNPVKKFFENYKTLLRVINKSVSKVIWCLDGNSRTFRHKKYAPYKAHRPEKTQEFRDFKEYIERILKRDYTVALHNDYEADDCVSTLARAFDGDVIIASADLDQCQLVSDTITMYKPLSPTEYEIVTPGYVLSRYGLYPSQIADLKALAGDKSDNIKLPIKLLGNVKGALMLGLYDTIEGIYEAIEGDYFIFSKFTDQLLTHKAQVLLFQELTTLNKDVPGIKSLLL